MKNECSIVGDLLALYQDGLVSEDTAAFVEEHLARCAVCRARLEQLRAPAAPQEAAQEERAFLAFAARWKKKRRRVLAAFAALALAAALLAACLFSAAAFGTANFVSAGWGLARVALLNEPWTEVASGPKWCWPRRTPPSPTIWPGGALPKTNRSGWGPCGCLKRTARRNTFCAGPTAGLPDGSGNRKNGPSGKSRAGRSLYIWVYT